MSRSRSASTAGLAIPAAFRAEPWLVLFYFLVATQTGHLLEHVAQMVQIHALGLRGPDARGVIGVLDVEWVHFIWNTWVLAAVAALLRPYRANRWLWLVLACAAWHELEHAVMMTVYLGTGVSGTPGLLASGGLLGGGLPVSRPDLHFLYNLLETTPLLLGYLRQIRAAGGRRARPAPLAA